MDPLQIIEKGEKAYDILRRIRAMPPEALSKIFAYLFAPALVAILTYVAFGRPGTLFGSEYALTVTPLTSFLEIGEPQSHAGVAVVVEASRDEYAIPLSRSRSQRIVTSLTREEWLRNQSNVSWSGGELSLKLPLLGVSRPIMILADGQIGNELLVAGGKIPVERLQLVARRSVNLVTWAFVSAIFGIGLGVASEDGVRKHGTGQDSSEEDEDEIVRGNS